MSPPRMYLITEVENGYIVRDELHHCPGMREGARCWVFNTATDLAEWLRQHLTPAEPGPRCQRDA